MSTKNQSPHVDPWVPLMDVLKLLHHPNFHWCAGGGLERLKYTEVTLRIDTRDNCCLVRDRNGKSVDMRKTMEAMKTTFLKGANDNLHATDPVALAEIYELTDIAEAARAEIKKQEALRILRDFAADITTSRELIGNYNVDAVAGAIIALHGSHPDPTPKDPGHASTIQHSSI